MNLYEWLWRHVEFWLKPEDQCSFSELMVRFYHDQPLIVVLVLLWVGYWFNRFFMTQMRDWILLSIGLLLGHLFWILKTRRQNRAGGCDKGKPVAR